MPDSKSKTADPTRGIVEAITRLRAAFLNAGLMEPVAIVLAGEEQALSLAHAFSRLALPTSVDTGQPWEGIKIGGMKVICNVQA